MKKFEKGILNIVGIVILVPCFLFAQLQDTAKISNQDTIGAPQEEKERVDEAGLKVGDEAPKFALRSLDGEYELLSKWSGKRLSRPASQPIRHVVVLSFFATWGKPCMKELPYLENLYVKYQGQDVKFFLIDITEATRSIEQYADAPEPGPFLRKRGVTIPILLDRYGMAMEKYVPTKTLPRLFVVDKFGTIRLIKRGFREGENFEEELSAMIDQLLAEGDEEKE